jgi:hypoxanthine phosphoribosyltransferase
VKWESFHQKAGTMAVTIAARMQPDNVTSLYGGGRRFISAKPVACGASY